MMSSACNLLLVPQHIARAKNKDSYPCPAHWAWPQRSKRAMKGTVFFWIIEQTLGIFSRTRGHLSYVTVVVRAWPVSSPPACGMKEDLGRGRGVTTKSHLYLLQIHSAFQAEEVAFKGLLNAQVEGGVQLRYEQLSNSSHLAFWFFQNN